MKKLLLLVIILSCVACSEEYRFTEKDYPVVLTQILSISKQGAELKGVYIDNGGGNIVESGFLFRSGTDQEYQTITVTAKNNEFSYQWKSDIAEGTECYVKSYVLTDEYTIYGNELSFKSKGIASK